VVVKSPILRSGVVSWIIILSCIVPSLISIFVAGLTFPKIPKSTDGGLCSCDLLSSTKTFPYISLGITPIT